MAGDDGGGKSAVIERLTLERFVAGGEALGRAADGRVVFVRGGLPGEEVDVELVEERSDWARGVAVAVAVPSSARVLPPCPRRLEGCGGCDWQHLDQRYHLDAKRDIVVDALRRTARIDSAQLEGLVSVGASIPESGYRTTARVVGGVDGVVGFRVERSREPASASGCLVAHPALADLIDQVRITPGVEVVLRVSAATGQRAAWWDESSGNVEGLAADVATGRHAVVHEVVAGHQLQVTVSSFFQSGPAAAELLVDAVCRSAGDTLTGAANVVDAYGGVGLFAVAAVPPSAHVTVVESSRSSVVDARANLAGRMATIVRSEVARWRPDPRRPVDVVIADPARPGLGRPGVRAIAAAGASTVVLVSCDPASGARDTALLIAAGYVPERVEVLDLFPRTHHVETVTRFRAAPDAGHRAAGDAVGDHGSRSGV